ncbi:Zn-dependent oxidoreductase [Microbacterium sp. Root166]|uniref:NAD(P)-dependent alcohol dehydrogenase n=1 Tax=Microbacterium sp. Root166 TaxID=1736478 RepID=UPI0006F32FD4|nr:NAD(P)-dependent alcohol dehydrogenase [Microbacterium sp. Root166]KQZ83311.1 Zn-dependent oxidoreductase [Microbacterium sp. Root166]
MTATERTATKTARDAETMLAAVANRFGGPEVVRVQEQTRPEPKADEVLVRVHASTVSIADHRMRAADLPRGLGFLKVVALGAFRPRRRILGMEAAGEVVEVGADATGFAVGDRVMVMRGARMGCHAQFVTARAAGAVVRIPDEMTFEDAAALVFGGYTAISFLDQVSLEPGTKVLVNGASGAVGSAAVQIAAHAGARVTAVTSARNADLVRGLGAARVVDYQSEDFAAGSERWDVIVECVGNAPFTRVERVLEPGGALLLVIADGPAMLRERSQSRRSGMRVTHEGTIIGKPVLERLLALAAEGAVRPVIDRTFPLDDIVAAHRYVDTGRKRGSVVLRVP